MGGSASLAELLNVILDKGIVVDAWVRLSVIGIEILTLEARIVVASVETYLRYAEAIGLTELASAPPSQGTRSAQQNGNRRENGNRRVSQDEVAGYLDDHPEGTRLGELQAYFDAPRDQMQRAVNGLVDENRARWDDEHKLYYPSNG
ncbi:MAG: gas vesicle structural protein GvpA [Chloroflexi bacterium]|nr:gas vesicle structural protein GvpA [Chloroflexota bacterium]